ncbi:MAG: choice-of-anchor D domain-containing protein [Planctomycetota bacterium]
MDPHVADFETDDRIVGFFHGPLQPGRPVPPIQAISALVPDETLLADETDGEDGDEPSGAPPFPVEDTFKLHSRPDSNFTIYLDFDGHTTVGTSWNAAYSVPEIVHPNYWGTFDNNFSSGRLELIQEIWQVVAEDFAPFDVNITTEEPVDIDDLRYNGAEDTRWGSRVVLTKDTFASCGCGGHAFIGAFDDTQDEPALVYNGGLNAGSETVSHEVGHQLGLQHDGVGSTTYYRGHGTGTTGWGPIMGAPFGKLITHWSDGEYFNASNTGQDDLAIITGSANFPYVGDDHADLQADAVPLIESNITDLDGFGIIERNDDVDWFKFTTGAGDVSLSVDVLGHKPNLDVWAGLFDSAGNFIAQANPQEELSATFATQTLAAGDYYVMIDGVARDGAYDPVLGEFVEPDPLPYMQSGPLGYSDYGSLGQYRISGTIVDPGTPTVSISADTDSAREGESASFTLTTSDGGSADVTVAIRSTRQVGPGLPAPNTTEAEDFSGPLTQVVSIVDGTATVLIPLVDDSLIEGTERFELEIIDPATYTIADRLDGMNVLESRTSFFIVEGSTASVEGDPGDDVTHTFNVNRLGRDDQTQVVGWRRLGAGGSPADNADFVGGDEGTISFAPGESTVPLEIVIAGDLDVEADEDYSIEIFVPDGESFEVESTRSTADGTIRDDESIISLATTAQFRMRQVSFSSGNFDHWAFDNFVISGTEINEDFDPETDATQWAEIVGGTPNTTFPESDGNSLFFNNANTRYATTVPVTPAPGATVDFDLIFASANGNGLNATENGEDVVLEYSLNGTDWNEVRRFDESEFTTWTSLSTDLPAEATFSPTEFLETDSGTNTQSILIPRQGYLDKSISIQWEITPIGADPVSADDFVGGFPSGTATFAAGDISTTLEIPISGDTDIEPDETFLLTITSNDGGPIMDATLMGTIRTDDVLAPQINVFGLGDTPINDGDLEPGSADGTEFDLIDIDGTATRTFRIENGGNENLDITGVQLTGDHTSDYSVTSAPAATLAPGESTTFEITFDPTDGGRRNATFEILSNDPDEPVFDVAISGLASDLRVSDILVNGGGDSRSQVSSVKVIFNRIVEEGPLNQAFSITNLDTGVSVGLVLDQIVTVDNHTELDLLFASGESVTELQNGSTTLNDGNYQLQVFGSAIQSTIGSDVIPLMEDVYFGGDGTNVVNTDFFFRLFGDLDGDRDVDGIDYARFADAFGSTTGSATYNAAADFELDGDVDGVDYGNFGQNFLKTI